MPSYRYTLILQSPEQLKADPRQTEIPGTAGRRPLPPKLKLKPVWGGDDFQMMLAFIGQIAQDKYPKNCILVLQEKGTAGEMVEMDRFKCTAPIPVAEES